MDKILRYCAGCLTDTNEDFYWDVQFETVEEACEWGFNHDCTHIYDNIEDTFSRI